ncbi:Retrovirus-related Pol polyprotein from transposon RE1 [Vitis vinifera]|uniref:Retrovirus-related Pol polyprotein from transposon RE1 n=1 Tax=Vitis vinifera TaxID=29760 RepID=A0A438ERW6_VITVI|nr:Retrovirus-related Pol polyprotein from transposon RE1 [Vitis vinifera]
MGIEVDILIRIPVEILVAKVVVSKEAVLMEVEALTMVLMDEAKVEESFQGPNFNFQNANAFYRQASPMSTMIATPELYNDVSWYHNSSASNNITPDANNLMQRQEITGQDRVHIGNGTGKIHKLSFSLSDTVYTAPLQLIHFDLWGPAHIQAIPQIGLRPLATPPVLPHISQLLLGFASSNSQDNPFRTSISTLVPSTQHKDKHLCDMDTFDAIANVDPTHTLETYVSVQPSLSNNIVGLVFAAIEARSLGNTHGMITRAKNGRYKPKIYLAELTEPSSVLVALHQPEYKKAILEEYRALQKNGTRSLVSLPPGRKAIGWFHQQVGFDFNETLSLVVTPTTIKIVLTIVSTRHWCICQLDINNAFLNGDLQEEVFMEQPQGFLDENNPHLVCKLHKALYDDILVTGSDSRLISQLIGRLNAEFAWKDPVKIDYFLGIQAKHTSESFHLSQTKYIGDLLSKSKMVHAKGISTPMTSGLKLRVSKGIPVDNVQLYRSTMGDLQYLTGTRLEIAYNVNNVC